VPAQFAAVTVVEAPPKDVDEVAGFASAAGQTAGMATDMFGVAVADSGEAAAGEGLGQLPPWSAPGGAPTPAAAAAGTGDAACIGGVICEGH